MTRHSKNCTAGTVYTYHERQRDTNSSGYGSKSVRLGKDSVKEFDCCCLTLQPCKDPVITQEGYLYDKEAILEYIIKKKKEIARKMKEYEKQKNRDQTELAELAKAEAESKKTSFEKTNLPYSESKPTAGGSSSTQKSISNMENNKHKELPSFWIPNMTPSAAPTRIEKPDEKVRCPMSGKTIKLKDLFPVKFTPINDRDTKTALITKQARYVCAVTNDVLSNSVPCAVLKTSGSVVTQECLEKLLKKDMVDPVNSKKMTDKDIIPIQRASGFSGSGQKLEAKKDGPVLMA